jgi:hypothetical protein
MALSLPPMARLVCLAAGPPGGGGVAARQEACLGSAADPLGPGRRRGCGIVAQLCYAHGGAGRYGAAVVHAWAVGHEPSALSLVEAWCCVMGCCGGQRCDGGSDGYHRPAGRRWSQRDAAQGRRNGAARNPSVGAEEVGGCWTASWQDYGGSDSLEFGQRGVVQHARKKCVE